MSFLVRVTNLKHVRMNIENRETYSVVGMIWDLPHPPPNSNRAKRTVNFSRLFTVAFELLEIKFSSDHEFILRGTLLQKQIILCAYFK